MPYEIRKVEKGWKVFTKGTDRPHSNSPLPLKVAKDQLKALYANNADEDAQMRGGMIGGFDDRDWNKLFGVYGGAEDDVEDTQAKEDAEAIVRLDKDEKSFDVEDATGEPEYLKLAKQYAKKAGYKDYASLKLATDRKHKLELRGVKFGSINNNDYIIYRQHFPSIADQKRRQYLARACKIKGDWAKSRYSPNSLAINILWDGSTKKGGDVDWWGLAKDIGQAASDHLEELFDTPEIKEAKRLKAEACKVCNAEGLPTVEKIGGRKGTKKGGEVDWWGLAKDIGQATSDHLEELFDTPEIKEAKRLKAEACKVCNAEGLPTVGGANKKMNYRKDGDDPRNWGYDEDVYIGPDGKPISADEYAKLFEKNDDTPVKMPVEPEYPEQPQFVGDPTQFKPQPYDPNNPLMYMAPVGAGLGANSQFYRTDIKRQGGRLAQTDAQETKVAKKIMNKVAGEANAAVQEISETPMSDANIRRYFPNAKVLKYSELADIEDITQLLPQPKSFFFLLYEQSFNSGHFTSVNRYIDNGRDTICFFCSYGSKIDAPLRWNSPEKNRELGQSEPYLTQLLRKSGKTIQYNRIQYQSKTSPKATCGAFATLWLKANIRDNMNLQEFHEWITEIKTETGLSYDAIAANAISNRAQ